MDIASVLVILFVVTAAAASSRRSKLIIHPHIPEVHFTSAATVGVFSKVSRQQVLVETAFKLRPCAAALRSTTAHEALHVAATEANSVTGTASSTAATTTRFRRSFRISASQRQFKNLSQRGVINLLRPFIDFGD